MEHLTIINLVLNVLIIGYLTSIKIPYYFEIQRHDYKNTFLGITLFKGFRDRYGTSVFHIKVRNGKKYDHLLERERLLQHSVDNRRQPLSAKFSWLETEEEVKEFSSVYRDLHPELVDRLVSNFHQKKLDTPI